MCALGGIQLNIKERFKEEKEEKNLQMSVLGR